MAEEDLFKARLVSHVMLKCNNYLWILVFKKLGCLTKSFCSSCTPAGLLIQRSCPPAGNNSFGLICHHCQHVYALLLRVRDPTYEATTDNFRFELRIMKDGC